MNTLHLEIGIGSQDAIYKEVIDLQNRKLRIIIRSDAYKNQCFAKIEFLGVRSERWNELADIHYSKMDTPSELAYSKSRDDLTSLFAADRAALLKQAADLLGLTLV